MADETPENDDAANETAPDDAALDAARAAAQDAARALDAVEAEAAKELPATDEEAAVAIPTPATAPAASGPAPEEGGPRPNRRKVREGIVVSDAMSSTVVVAVVERVRHPKYGKTVQRTKKLYVHDAEDSAKVGDRVRVQETRPLSKLKRWRLTEVVERAR
jgi:small subunit ribosomal protein S17